MHLTPHSQPYHLSHRSEDVVKNQRIRFLVCNICNKAGFKQKGNHRDVQGEQDGFVGSEVRGQKKLDISRTKSQGWKVTKATWRDRDPQGNGQADENE